MGGNGLGLACPLEHEELGKNGDGLEVDAECPEDLTEGAASLVVVVEDEGKDESGAHEVFETDGVDGGIMGGPELDLHEVEDVAAGGDEEDLHDKAVERGLEEEIHVAGEEDNRVEELRLERDSSTRLGDLNLVEKDEDGGQVGQISGETEDVHGAVLCWWRLGCCLAAAEGGGAKLVVLLIEAKRRSGRLAWLLSAAAAG